MWQQLLKKEQKNIIIPPGFTNCKVTGSNNCVYDIKMHRPLRTWSVCTAQGDVVREAEQAEIQKEIKRYPKVRCSFLSQTDNNWVVVLGESIGRIRLTPRTEVPVTPLTMLVGRSFGSAIIFDDFDFRDTSPWKIDDALAMLHNDKLTTKAPSWLDTAQKFVFQILAENELNNRVPKAERNIKDILDTEGAQLINLRETREGYSIDFNYRGKRRNLRIREDLVLLDSGMCLSGRDRDYALDSFMAILQYEDEDEFAG